MLAIKLERGQIPGIIRVKDRAGIHLATIVPPKGLYSDLWHVQIKDCPPLWYKSLFGCLRACRFHETYV